jgi:hypothetical protein
MIGLGMESFDLGFTIKNGVIQLKPEVAAEVAKIAATMIGSVTGSLGAAMSGAGATASVAAGTASGLMSKEVVDRHEFDPQIAIIDYEPPVLTQDQGMETLVYGANRAEGAITTTINPLTVEDPVINVSATSQEALEGAAELGRNLQRYITITSTSDTVTSPKEMGITSISQQKITEQMSAETARGA